MTRTASAIETWYAAPRCRWRSASSPACASAPVALALPRPRRRRHARGGLARARLGDEPSGLLYAVNRRYADDETTLADGDEVALIPPVSGGDFRLTPEPLSLDAVVREVQRDDAGAVASFLGTVRNRSRDRDVLYLEYEAYEGMAEETMAELARELSERHDLYRGRHPPPRRPRRDRRAERRDRRLRPPHTAALAACKEAIDTLKQRCRSGRRRSTEAARRIARGSRRLGAALTREARRGRGGTRAATSGAERRPVATLPGGADLADE